MSKKLVIKSEKGFGAFLTELTRRATLRRIKVLLEGESEVQDALVSQLDDLKSGSTDSADLDEKDDAAPDDDAPELDVNDEEEADDEIKEISPETIIDKLNTIRSGHSLKRSDIREQMEEYIAALEDAEKVALNAFLEGIAAIITGSEEGDEAEEPSPEVKMKTSTKVVGDAPKKKVIVQADDDETVAVKKTKKVPKPKKSGSAEDTSPPIKVS
jgi:hypothetical protein